MAASLTPVMEDYLETVLRLQEATGSCRVSDIAAELGTRLPTVTRTVAKLTELGFLHHEDRKAVSLTARGRKLALDVLHRHTDLVTLFTRVLGLPPDLAETDTCQIEHGLSAPTAQRLHEFLLWYETLPRELRDAFAAFRDSASTGRADFRNLPESKASGWRS